MAKPKLAEKLKSMARDLKDEKKNDVTKLGDKTKQEVRKKEYVDGSKSSGRKG